MVMGAATKKQRLINIKWANMGNGKVTQFKKKPVNSEKSKQKCSCCA